MKAIRNSDCGLRNQTLTRHRRNQIGFGVEKSEIRISKSETNSNFQNPNSLNFLFGTFKIWSFEIVSNFACLREAASAKAGISCFGFEE